MLFLLSFSSYNSAYPDILNKTLLPNKKNEYSIRNLPKIIDKKSSKKSDKDTSSLEKEGNKYKKDIKAIDEKKLFDGNKEILQNLDFFDDGPFSHKEYIKNSQKSWIKDMTKLQKHFDPNAKNGRFPPSEMLNKILRFKTKIEW